MADKIEGQIKFFSYEKNFGFIKHGEDDENEIFFSGFNVKTPGWTPRDDELCQFNIGHSKDGRESAMNVTLDKA